MGELVALPMITLLASLAMGVARGGAETSTDNTTTATKASQEIIDVIHIHLLFDVHVKRATIRKYRTGFVDIKMS